MQVQQVLGFSHLNHSSLLSLNQRTVIKCYWFTKLEMVNNSQCPSDTSELQAALVASLFPEVSQGANYHPKPCVVSDRLEPDLAPFH